MRSNKNNTPSSFGWVFNRSGHEYTQSVPIISKMLNWLRKQRKFVTVTHKGYQSCGTIIIEANPRKIVIDKPKDWPATHTKIKVVFRNPWKLWGYFKTELLSSSINSLYCKVPKELYLIQRRQHFRITLPEGSMATFLYNREKCKLNMKDLSTGGMLLSSTSAQLLPKQHQTIENIIIIIPTGDSPKQEEKGVLHFKVKEGEIVRSYANKIMRLFYAGVKFFPSRQEEERIMKYIRQRELVQLRKGILNL